MSHGTTNTSGHIVSSGGTPLAPFGSGCGDEREQEGELESEDEVDDNENEEL